MIAARLRRLNLYSRILLWFLLNVAVLAAAAFAVLHWQFSGGFRGALGTIAADRLQAIGQQMRETLSASPASRWDAILADLAERHDIQVGLLSPPDRHVAGHPLKLPREVNERLEQMLRGEQRGGRPPAPGGSPPFDPLAPPSFFGGPPPPPTEPPPEDAARVPFRYGAFSVHAGEPKRYWSVVRLPPPAGWPLRPAPAVLVIVSRSMTGGGLFFDLRPWLGGIFGAMVLSALLWIPFVRGITRGIRAHMRAAEELAKGRFDVRVPEDRGDELGRLAHAVNQMAVHLDGLVRGQKRFLGDVAHELCSPIARMEMSLALLEQQITPLQSPRLEDVRDELRQISTLVNELLSFSKAALGQQSLAPLEAVDLLPLITQSLKEEMIDPGATDIDIPTPCRVLARPDLLRRAIGNVLRNALRHAPGSPLAIRAVASGGNVRLCFEDQGPGVPAESLPRLFEPFYRVDASRTRETGGVGLGLAIVKAGIEACGGAVVAQSREPHGLRILVTLPSA